MRVSLLRWGQDFRNVIYWALNFEGFPFFFPLDRKYGTDVLSCGCNVKQQRLFADRGSEHRLGGKQGFELCKRCVSFRSPLNLSNFFISRQRGNAFSPRREMNRLKAAKQPVSFWTSCTRTGRFIQRIAPTFSGFASIPHSETRKLSDLPPRTPNVHFDGLSLISYLLRLAKVSARSVSRSEPLRDLTTMASMYASTFWLI